MADLNWIETKDRLPNVQDCNSKGQLYGLCNGVVMVIHSHYVRDYSHWLPFDAMPLPKLWRVATIHDLAVRLKAIPCRVRNRASDQWQEATFMGYGFWDDAFLCDGTWWKFCEIEESNNAQLD